MLQPGQTVGRYTVLQEIGRGGMAVVYLARQEDLQRDVALKELGALHAPDAAMAERFARESRVVASLTHPNIVTVFESFDHGGLPYIAMEYVTRGSLRSLIGRMTINQVAGVLEGLLAGVAHAQQRGIVHRDLKPENVLITDEGRVKIADFGIAKAFNAAWTVHHPTATGMAIGTPQYMAPEQAMGKDIGPWTDIYATGCMAYELFCGRVPFHDVGGEPMAVLMHQLTEPPPPLASIVPGLDARLIEWTEWMMSKQPAERPASAAAAWDALEDIVVALAGPTWRRDARLVSHEGDAAARPLTPAPFEEPKPDAPSPPSLPRVRPPSLSAPPGTAAAAGESRRRIPSWLPLAGVAAAGAAITLAAVTLLGGGDDGGGDSPKAATAGMPACLQEFVGETSGAAVIDGIETDVLPAADADGRTLAVVLGNPKAIGAVKARYQSKPKEFFTLEELRDAECGKPDVTLYGSGRLPNFEPYDKLQMILDGRPYRLRLAVEDGQVRAVLAQDPLPGLKITEATREGRRLRVAGTLAAEATSLMTVTFTAAGEPPLRIEHQVEPKNGGFEDTARIPATVTTPGPINVTVAYPGDDARAPQEARTDVAG